MPQTTYLAAHPVGLAGALVDASENDVISRILSDATSIPFGVGLKEGTTGGTNCAVPAAAGARIIGVALRTDNYENRSLTTTLAIAQKDVVSVLRRGRVWVLVEQDVVVGDDVFVRHTARLTNTQLGGFRTDADTASSVDYAAVLANARFVSAASAGGLAQLEIDLLGT